MGKHTAFTTFAVAREKNGAATAVKSNLLTEMYKHTILFMTVFMSALFTAAYAAGENDGDECEESREEAMHEIDNYDFLYYDTYYDYDVASVDELLDEAFSHIGTCYRSGCKGPSAFDCSGFTSYVFGQFDMAIGASSRDQYANNEPVRKGDLQRGDLVFFTSPGSGRRVGHVGIVVDVDREKGTFSFIHASSRGGVKVSESTDGYYARRYIGARRVI